MVADRQEEPATERPSTNAGEALLMVYPDINGRRHLAELIVAIEREARVPAPLDVEHADSLWMACYRLANAAESLSAHAKHPDDEGHRAWFRPAIGDVDRELATARRVLARLSNQPSTEPALHVFDLNDAWVVHRREDHHDDEGCWPIPCSTRITPRLFPHVAEGPISGNSASTEPAQGGER